MVDISDLKTYILEEKQIETILESLGCHNIRHKNGFYQCANPDGDNPTAICVYENDFLTTVNYTRDIAGNGKGADIITLVEFFEKLSFPQAVKQICQWVGLDYYHDFERDLPKSVLLLKELLAMQSGDDSDTEEKPLKPIPETILGYYKPRVNDLFANDGIPYLTQAEFEVGYDEYSNYITIPIRDELGTLVGVKGRYFGNPEQQRLPKYTYLEKCPKGKVLYGLYKTMPYIKREGKVYVGEAEKSVMQMWSMGVRCCVATGGKTISNSQIEMLTRLCVEVIFLFDKDVKEDELSRLSTRFVDGAAVYAAIDDRNLLDEKESPTDNSDKFHVMISECVRRIK